MPAEAHASTGTLHGVRVLDLSRVLAGPYATMMLADLGADVIKVESPGGDDTRHWKPPVDADGRSTYFASVNRNKRSVVLDLKDATDRQRAIDLALEADVVVQNFKPGTPARFDLDFDSLSAANPGLVYVSISGFGDDGGAHLPGYDLLAQAMGGLMSITGATEGPPTKAGVAVVDVLTGMNAVIGALAALRAREVDGQGQHVQVNLLSSLLAAQVNQSSSAAITGNSPGRLGNDHPSIAPYALYQAADRELVLAVGNDAQFARLAGVLGHPEWVEDERFANNPARVAHHDQLRVLLEAALASDSAQAWVEQLTAVGVPAGAVNTLTQAIDLAASLGLEPLVSPVDGDGPVTVRTPIWLSRDQPVYRTPPPDLPDRGGEVRWGEA